MLIEKIKKGLDSTYYLLGVVIAMIIFWAIPYTLLEINILKYQETVKLFENIICTSNVRNIENYI